jgi:serine/threonine protein kinase
VLVDFGAVHDWSRRSGERSLSIVGTIGYIAPEQAMARRGPASDLFALGATLVHALGHRHPADLAPPRPAHHRFEDRVGCSLALIAVCKRLVEPDLDHRYARAADARADLLAPPLRCCRRRPRCMRSLPAAADSSQPRTPVGVPDREHRDRAAAGRGDRRPARSRGGRLGLLGVLSLAIFVAAGVLALGPSFARGDGDDSVRG